MDEILITGGMVTLRSVSETRKIPTKEFYESLSLAVGMKTPILPQQVIFYAAQEGRNIYVTHQEPQQKTLKVKVHDNVKEFTIKLPHIYFFHKYQYNAFEDLYVFGAKSQIYDITEMLYLLPLKNLYTDCRVCLGRDLKFGLEGRLNGKIIRVENYFWNSVFNSDLDSNYQNAGPGNWSGDPLTCWHVLSEGENFDPCEVNWQRWNSWLGVIDQLLEENT